MHNYARRPLRMSLLAATLCLPAAHAQRGWWPQELQVTESPGSLAVTTRYYRFEHDLTRGGAIRLVKLTHGKSANLLVRPMESRVGVPLPSGAATERRTTPVTIYSDLNDSSPAALARREGKAVIVSTDAALRTADGRDSNVRVKTTYTYRWGYVKIHKEFHAARAASLGIVTPLSTMVDPSLSDFGYRPGVAEEVGSSPFMTCPQKSQPAIIWKSRRQVRDETARFLGEPQHCPDIQCG